MKKFGLTMLVALTLLTGSLVVKPEQADAHANAWHLVSSYCYNHTYRNLYAWAYYYDGWSHLFSSRYEQNTYYRC
jgi:hypothetical protein